MPATFGAAVLPDGVEAQTDCVVQSLSDKSSVETYSYRNEVGVTVKLVPGKMITREVTLETIGKGSIALTGGAYAAGVLKKLSVKVSESNDDFQKTTETFKSYSTVGAAD
jgi:hypothetical protein